MSLCRPLVCHPVFLSSTVGKDDDLEAAKIDSNEPYLEMGSYCAMARSAGAFLLQASMDDCIFFSYLLHPSEHGAVRFSFCLACEE